MKKFLLISASIAFATTLSAQVQNPATPASISLTAANVAYVQNFNKSNSDGLQATTGTFTQLPAGWAISETGTSTDANGSYRSGPGSSTTRDTYSFGTTNNDDDRALGSLTSTNMTSIIVGSTFTNNIGSAITSIAISYKGEQWRNGGSGTAGKLSFSYSLDATSLNTGTWTPITALDFLSPITTGSAVQLIGNDAVNSTSKLVTITGLNIAVAAKIWIRWENANASGGSTDDGIAIDDVSVTPNPATAPVRLVFFNSSKSGSAINLKWETLSETNNDYFEILRSVDGQTFSSLTKIKGKGNSSDKNSYSYSDFNPLRGTNYYKLKQVDFDGTEVIYPAITAQLVQEQLAFNIYSNSENKYFLDLEAPESSSSTISIYNLGGQVVSSQNIRLERGSNKINLDVAKLEPSIYLLKISGSSFELRKKFILN
jgi:hypothetical protein